MKKTLSVTFRTISFNAVKIGTVLLILRGLTACKHQRIEPITEPSIIVQMPDPCGVKTVSYKMDVAPMMAAYCVSSVCHGDNAPPRGINLSNHYVLKAFIQEDSSRFLGSIRHEGFYSPMPIDRPIKKLDSCSTKRLETWILQNMPNN